ncbi:MAG: hypothetical protein OJF61_000680 [Rhodanobacteraceae bacterium]|nr:MAG: hypothetical protein OJF61_000680 [Rhodanobacteraceae bacterium]
MPMRENRATSRLQSPRTRYPVMPGDAPCKPLPVRPIDNIGHTRSSDSDENTLACFDAATIRSSPEHWTNLGRALQEAGRYGEARTALREARRSEPHDSRAILCLADLEMECGRYQHAYDMFQILLDEFPERVDVRIHAARACHELGKHKRAKSLVEGWPRWALDHDLAAELAALLIRIGKVRAGLVLLKTMPDLSRIGTRALARLASALAQSGRLQKARHCLALLPAPETVRNPALREEILTACARLALLGGNLSGARRFLEFLDTPPVPGICRSAQAYFLLAEICYHQMDMEAAKSALVTGRCIQMKAAAIAPSLMVEFSSFP